MNEGISPTDPVGRATNAHHPFERRHRGRDTPLTIARPFSTCEALDFYGSIFEFTLRNRFERMAWIDLGDQFIALSATSSRPADDDRHFGLAVDSKEATQQAMAAAGVDALPGRGLRFRDPWGNQIEIVGYREVQFTKAAGVARGMRIDGLEKTADATEELRGKGLLAED